MVPSFAESENSKKRKTNQFSKEVLLPVPFYRPPLPAIDISLDTPMYQKDSRLAEGSQVPGRLSQHQIIRHEQSFPPARGSPSGSRETEFGFDLYAGDERGGGWLEMA